MRPFGLGRGSPRRRCCLAFLLLVVAEGCARGPTGAGTVPATYDIASYQDNVGDSPTDTAAAQADAGTAGPGDAGPADSAALDAGKADAGGGALSCQGKCMAAFQPGKSCQCNDQCEKYGNCCADWVDLCKPKLNSCVGRCDAPYNGNLPCQCSWSCGKNGDCCGDYLAVCEADKDLDWLEATPEECGEQSAWFGFKSAKDGDTIALTNGDIVRFLVVNTPEITTADCYAKLANDFTWKVMKKAVIVCLVKDPNQPDKDQYDRLLRYVYFKEPGIGNKTVQLNARLVRLGFGPVFYPYAKGNAHEQISVLMQQKARQDKAGGWGACNWQ